MIIFHAFPERYNEAFACIAKAVEIVKDEKDEEEDQKDDHERKWRKKLGVDPELLVTADMLDLKENADAETAAYSPRSAKSSKKDEINQDRMAIQRLYLFASKTGVIGNKEPDVNEFLNIQIEDCYLKIEKAIQHKQDDIVMMRKKIDQLEGNAEDEENEPPPKAVEGKDPNDLAKRRYRMKNKINYLFKNMKERGRS